MPLNSFRIAIAEVVIVVGGFGVLMLSSSILGSTWEWFGKGLVIGAFLMYMMNVIDEHLTRDYERTVAVSEQPRPKVPPEKQRETEAAQTISTTAAETAANTAQRTAQVMNENGQAATDEESNGGDETTTETVTTTTEE